MGRSRYKITEPTAPHYVTCTVLHWLPIFTRQETVEIILTSLRYLQSQGLTLYAWVVLENHLHLIGQSEDIGRDLARFKSYTAKTILQFLLENNVTTYLDQFAFYKKAHKVDRQYQFWQEGSHPKLIENDEVMRQKIEYIHRNPVKRGYVDEPKHWRYSSARNYEGIAGLLDVCRLW